MVERVVTYHEEPVEERVVRYREDPVEESAPAKKIKRSRDLTSQQHQDGVQWNLHWDGLRRR